MDGRIGNNLPFLHARYSYLAAFEACHTYLWYEERGYWIVLFLYTMGSVNATFYHELCALKATKLFYFFNWIEEVLETWATALTEQKRQISYHINMLVNWKEFYLIGIHSVPGLVYGLVAPFVLPEVQALVLVPHTNRPRATELQVQVPRLHLINVVLTAKYYCHQ